MSIFQLDVNGRLHTVDIDGNMPLLWALRDVLGLKGPSSAAASRSAAPAPSTSTGGPCAPARSTWGSPASRRSPRSRDCRTTAATPARRRGSSFGVPQCGFCQPGQIMSASALLAANAATRATTDIDDAMRGNICRCGTYPRIREAIHKAAGAKS